MGKINQELEKIRLIALDIDNTEIIHCVNAIIGLRTEENQLMREHIETVYNILTKED